MRLTETLHFLHQRKVIFHHNGLQPAVFRNDLRCKDNL